MVAAAASGDGADRGVVGASEGDEVPAGEVPDGPGEAGHRTAHATVSARRCASDRVSPRVG